MMHRTPLDEGMSHLPGPQGLIRRLTAMQLFVLSFAGLITVGTAGLLWLPGLYTGQDLGFVDALFTATSAVCVTGLIVVDTATYFTPLGQAWILLLIQAGGLGILTFTTLLISALGRRSPLGIEEVSGGAHAAVVKHVEIEHLVRTVFVVTFGLEAVGAVGLWVIWMGELGPLGAIWPAVFHAVSAFCNAGFSTFSDSLAGFDGSVSTLLVVSSLVVAGGLGFLVIEDLRARWVRGVTRRLSVHTRLVLGTTAFLLAAGWLLFLTFEWNHELAGMGLGDRLANAAFMSVTPRTAGFNTVDYFSVTNPSLLLTMGLMMVGGSPGSTAGGFKTVTLALLFLLLISKLRGERRVFAFDRTIPSDTIQRATGVVMGGLAVLALAVFVLMISEAPVGDIRSRVHFVTLAFESASAFGTVGLSMGVTTELTPVGRVVVTVLMFLGRVGPAAVVAAMATSMSTAGLRFRYGEEDVSLG